MTEPAWAKYKVTARIPRAGGAAAGCTVKVASAGGDGPPEPSGDQQRPVVKPVVHHAGRRGVTAAAGQIRDLSDADPLVIDRHRDAARGDRCVELIGGLPAGSDLHAGRQRSRTVLGAAPWR